MNILHPEEAILLPGPANMPNVTPLPVIREADGFVSFWQPDEYDREALERGGSITLRIFGNVHPVVGLGVVEYPGTLASHSHDEALERAVESIGAYTEPEKGYFKAGARWQSGRPIELTFEPLPWFNPPGVEHVHICQDEVSGHVLCVSEHDGKAYYGSEPDPAHLTDKTVDELKKELETARNTRLMKAIRLRHDG